MNLFLIGLRGTGKSTVARLVAERFGWSSIDADEEIERQAGKSIAQIFADEGEAVFRDWESRVVALLAAGEQTVVALGGGAILREENRAAIGRGGRTVWLTASPETLWQRISADAVTAQRRPNLTATGGINEIIATLDARRAVYRQCAQLEVDTERKTPQQVADAIVDWWRGSRS